MGMDGVTGAVAAAPREFANFANPVTRNAVLRSKAWSARKRRPFMRGEQSEIEETGCPGGAAGRSTAARGGAGAEEYPTG